MLEQLYSTMKDLKAQYEASQKVSDAAHIVFEVLPFREKNAGSAEVPNCCCKQ